MHTSEIKITKEQREQEKRAQLKEKKLQARIDFEIKDEKLNISGHESDWKRIWQANKSAGPDYEAYAKPIFQAADRWGRLMQVQMKKQGLKIPTKELVEKTGAYFGDWGIWARRLLVDTWIYGAQLGRILDWPEEVIQSRREEKIPTILQKQKERN